MKICPKCKRTYSDTSLNYCLDDGLRLSYVDDDFETISQNRGNGSIKFLIPIAGLGLLIILAGMTLGLYSFSDEIVALFGTKPGPTPNSPGSPFVSTQQKDKAEILEMLKTVRKAWAKDDLSELDDLMAEEYIEENSDGQRTNKRQILTPLPVGERTYLEHNNIKVKINGDEATATGKGISKVKLAGFETTIRFSFKTDFEKRKGRWLATYSYINILRN